MRGLTVGLAMLTATFVGPAFAGSVQDEIQEEEQPGSEIELDVGGGGLQIGREGKMKEGIVIDGDAGGIPAINDPDSPATDPIDNELPGEGPEDLSGPEDED